MNQANAPSPASPGACIVCGRTPLVISHLMPAAIGLALKGDGKHFWIGTTEKPGKRVTQSGLTDRFLCHQHEQAIHHYEKYAIEFIRDFKLSVEEIAAGRFRRDGTDNEALIRFVCSVLWRFHHSTRPEADDVNLGEWEPNFRDVTFGGSVNQAPDVLMRALHQTLLPKDAFMNSPGPIDMWGRRGLQFSVPGLLFSIKLDHEDWPISVQQIVLNQTPTWIDSAVVPMTEEAWRAIKLAGVRMQERRLCK